ncbi:fumarylacetoacetate hydrolase family protein [Haladaptatus sp. NG-SE-30]
MRLLRFATEDGVRVGVSQNGVVEDVTERVDGFSDLLERMTKGDSVPESNETYEPAAISYLPPTTPVNTVFAVALNYHSHIQEAGVTDREFERPLIFLKLYRSLVGHGESIQYHRDVVERLDYEGELAAVIGKPARNVSVDEALDYVAGYTILNDVTARNVQRLRAGESDALDWFSSKAMEGTTPVGPTVVTTDEISDPQSLRITSRYNGDVMQDEETSLMIYSTAELVAYAASRLTLHPGDVIATGTPEGVGEFQNISMTEGDTIAVEIGGIGTLSNTIGESEE